MNLIATLENKGDRHVDGNLIEDRFDFIVGDGYDFAGALESEDGWRSAPGWGLDGWDAGEWPYVVFGLTTGKLRKGWGWLVRVEGDVTIHWFGNETARDASIDKAVQWYWQQNPERYGFTGKEDFTEDRYSGTFSWKRLNESKEQGDSE